MGFFKDATNKLKRVVSVKNLVRGVTGNFSAIAEDAQRVMTTEDPKKVAKQVNSLTNKTFAIPQPVSDVVKQAETNYTNNLINSVAGMPAVQDANAFMSKLWIQSMWNKYKTQILLFGGALVALLVLKFGIKTNNRKRRR
ncbi:hypothetical protein [Flavobacterium sp. TSSA_36]|uniref:hypothetical protein n=1 Tax=Flavobacterium sp. TSSA_36 TaxID=3447669 RepID=UPI003F2D9DD8